MACGGCAQRRQAISLAAKAAQFGFKAAVDKHNGDHEGARVGRRNMRKNLNQAKTTFRRSFHAATS